MDFPASFHGLRKTVMGETLITLSVDESFTGEIVGLMSMKIGSGLYVRLAEADKKEEPANNDTKEKFRRTMHAKIRECAEAMDISEEECKNRLKGALKVKGLIKESTTELDLKGYAVACSILDDRLKAYGKD